MHATDDERNKIRAVNITAQ